MSATPAAAAGCYKPAFGARELRGWRGVLSAGGTCRRRRCRRRSKRRRRRRRRTEKGWGELESEVKM